MKDDARQKDFYSVLGAAEGATREEIERCYKRLAQRHHPDRGGDEERMKALNEAWRVLGDAETRHAYDAERARRSRVAYRAYTPVTSHAAKADPISGRIVGALLCLFSGLVLLFLVRVHYVVFLWPLALLALGIIVFGVLIAHGALAFARETVEPGHFARRFVWAQELFFWSCVVVGGYGVWWALAAV